MSKDLELYTAQLEILVKEYDLNVNPEPKIVTLEKVKYNPTTGNFEDVTVKNIAMKKKELDDFVSSAKSNFPFQNILESTYFNQENENNGAVFNWYNPQGHTLDFEKVSWDYNDITKEMANQLHMLDTDGNPRCCSVLTEVPTFGFLKINNTRAITKNDINKTLGFVNISGFFGVHTSYPYKIQGKTTAMLGVVGVANGSIRFDTYGDDVTVSEGEVKKNIANIVTINGKNHYDAFANSEILSDELEWYVGFPVVVAGDAIDVPIENILINLKG